MVRIHTRGFTLIETIIYVVLFSIIMVGGFVTAFELMQSSGQLGAKHVTQEETNFLLRKIDWALSGTTTAVTVLTSPSAGTPYTTTLSITRANHSPNPVEIRFNAGLHRAEIREGGVGAWTLLTTPNVTVDSLQFRYLPAVGNGPMGVVATTSINGIVATTTRYFRK
jgi:type II secretory pathway pseudopilin PulG